MLRRPGQEGREVAETDPKPQPEDERVSKARRELEEAQKQAEQTLANVKKTTRHIEGGQGSDDRPSEAPPKPSE